MSDQVTRRGFIGGSAVALGFAFAGAGSLDPFVREAAAATTRPALGYGPLQYKAGEVIALPEGFSYKILGEVGKMTEGGIVHPDDPDAMGVFERPAGGSILVTNHENGGSEAYPVPHDNADIVYDEGGIGGTTTIEVDADGNNVLQYASAAGHVNNCAGGITPWGTWLTCEETEARAGGKLTKDHGYVFEVDPTSQAANHGKSNLPLKFLGRFAHEATATDPRTGHIYLTEDAGNPNGLYFRWSPPKGYRLGKDSLLDLAVDGDVEVGTLEAMKCFDSNGNHVKDLAAATDVNTTYRVRWVPVPDRDARQVSIRKQFSDDEVTRSRKLEGQWWGDGGAYFVCSFARLSDGSVNEHDGQVWFFDPRKERITLKTIFGVNPDVDNENNHFDGPDNITVSAHGGLILAEDGSGKSHLVGVTEQGKSYPLALNQSSDSEFAGPAFSADGKTLFVNIQSGPGYTLAITGPWGRPSNAAPHANTGNGNPQRNSRGNNDD
ncbi:alkaline phosphatase PhoX [Microlunatus sp. Y2014]|uniref:alkaline phosphatase PhoX n=1 Tax=Microlunatus sp. Y2014 TaxID=3418488 RepID=UPI003DA75A6A